MCPSRPHLGQVSTWEGRIPQAKRGQCSRSESHWESSLRVFTAVPGRSAAPVLWEVATEMRPLPFPLDPV